MFLHKSNAKWMMLKQFTLLALLLGAQCLTQEELAAFTPRHPDYTDFNTNLKSVVCAFDISSILDNSEQYLSLCQL